MNNIEITANTFDEYIRYEQWLFNLTPPEDTMGAIIFCRENSTSYFYKVVKEFGKLRFITNGEY